MLFRSVLAREGCPGERRGDSYHPEPTSPEPRGIGRLPRAREPAGLRRESFASMPPVQPPQRGHGVAAGDDARLCGPGCGGALTRKACRPNPNPPGWTMVTSSKLAPLPQRPSRQTSLRGPRRHSSCPASPGRHQPRQMRLPAKSSARPTPLHGAQVRIPASERSGHKVRPGRRAACLRGGAGWRV
jgi:hypothetical protein